MTRPTAQEAGELPVVAWIEHHKGGDNLSWDNPGKNSSALVSRAAAQATIEALRRERYELVDVLHRGGFVRCDIAACNCGSWHARFGWPERFREFTEALEEHGANLHAGKTALTVLKESLAELEALRAALSGAGPKGGETR